MIIIMQRLIIFQVNNCIKKALLFISSHFILFSFIIHFKKKKINEYYFFVFSLTSLPLFVVVVHSNFWAVYFIFFFAEKNRLNKFTIYVIR